jgi:DNA-binding response OmpR family regulator
MQVQPSIARCSMFHCRTARATSCCLIGEEVWTFGDLQIEAKQHTARIAGEPLRLSPREFWLLLELAREAGTVVSKGILAERLEPLGDAVDFKRQAQGVGLRRSLILRLDSDGNFIMGSRLREFDCTRSSAFAPATHDGGSR